MALAFSLLAMMQVNSFTQFLNISLDFYIYNIIISELMGCTDLGIKSDHSSYLIIYLFFVCHLGHGTSHLPDLPISQLL